MSGRRAPQSAQHDQQGAQEHGSRARRARGLRRIGQAMVRGIGVLFLMWNAPYLPVIWDPEKHWVLGVVVLAQQAIGLIGETWMWLTLPSGHAPLRATGLRFILFDGLGLVLMAVAFGYLTVCRRRTSRMYRTLLPRGPGSTDPRSPPSCRDPWPRR